MKQNVHVFIKPPTHLVNSSVKNGIFLDELKIAKVVPIFKVNGKVNIENYRPITVLSVFSKIMKKVMYNYYWILLQNIIYYININLDPENCILLTMRLYRWWRNCIML